MAFPKELAWRQVDKTILGNSTVIIQTAPLQKGTIVRSITLDIAGNCISTSILIYQYGFEPQATHEYRAS